MTKFDTTSLRAASRALRILVGPAMVLLGGCMSLVTSFTSGFAEDLGNSILDNPDVEMVQEGAPAYLLLVDALVAKSPDNPNLLKQSARLKSAYAAAFVSDTERAQLLTASALDEMDQAVCLSLKKACGLRTRPYDEFEAWVLVQTDVDALYQLGSVWTSWIQARSDDFVAIADLGPNTLAGTMSPLVPSLPAPVPLAALPVPHAQVDFRR